MPFAFLSLWFVGNSKESTKIGHLMVFLLKFCCKKIIAKVVVCVVVVVGKEKMGKI